MKRLLKAGNGTLATLLFLLIQTFSVIAQPSKVPFEQLDGKRTVTIVPGAGYKAGNMHARILGKNWRALWTTPVEVPVLRLESFAGGLIPVEKGGDYLTVTLLFRGENGKQYLFRTLDKEPAREMSPDIHDTAVSAVIQDQVSTSNPFSEQIVSPLLDAAGIYHVKPEIFVMPYDQSRLGKYSHEFAGLVGTIEEHPSGSDSAGSGFMHANKISGTYAVLDDLQKNDGNKIDARAYLKARLFDIFIGDWDRQSDQWLWAGYTQKEKTRWVPIPMNRFNAFSRQDGIAKVIPQMQGFGPKYPSIKFLTLSARSLDRRIFSAISRAEWEAVCSEIQQKLTDRVIHEAVNRMPPVMYAQEGLKLEADLRSRRDQLQAASSTLYALYSEDVDIYATDKVEYLKVHRQESGDTEVTLYHDDQHSDRPDGKVPVYYRLFHPRETKEVRIYLQGGDDVAVVDGFISKDNVKVRIIGGSGNNRFEDHSVVAPTMGSRVTGKKTFFYDDAQNPEFIAGKHTSIERHNVVPAGDQSVDKEKFDLKPRDSGTELVANITNLRVNYSPDYGPFIGWGAALEKYGFGYDQFRYHMEVDGGVAYNDQPLYKFNYMGDFRTLFRNTSLLVEAGTTGLDFINYYGLGNDHYFNGTGLSDKDFETRTITTSLGVFLRYPVPLVRKYYWSAGIAAKKINLDIKPGSYLDMNKDSVPGIDVDFTSNLQIGFHYDSRDCGEALDLSPGRQTGRLAAVREIPGTTALSGTMFDIEGLYYPEFAGNKTTFGKVRSEVRTYIPLSASRYSRVALRLGGEKIWGDYPFYEAAYIGGATSLRGFDRQRFAGDAAIYANSELRLYFGKFKFLVPVLSGPIAFIETGKVFVDDEHSKQWHTGIGGGVWFSFFKPRYTVSLAYARGLDDGRLLDDAAIYVRTGFSF
jgi:hypothetical protein